MPSAFEPMVLTSRFISWSRKSSLRPQGSRRVDSAAQCARWAAEADHLLADVGRAANRTISCATTACVDRQLRRASSATPLAQPRLAARRCPRGRRRSQLLDDVAEQSAGRAVELRRAGSALRVVAHRRSRSASASSTAPRQRRDGSIAGPRRMRPLATVERLREAQQIAGRQRAARRARARARARAPRPDRLRHRLVDLDDVDAARRASLRRASPASTRPRASRCCTRPGAPTRAPASDCGTRSCTSRNR